MASQLASDCWVAPEHMCCRLREEESPTDAGFHEMDVEDVGYRAGYSLQPEGRRAPRSTHMFGGVLHETPPTASWSSGPAGAVPHHPSRDQQLLNKASTTPR